MAGSAKCKEYLFKYLKFRTPNSAIPAYRPWSRPRAGQANAIGMANFFMDDPDVIFSGPVPRRTVPGETNKFSLRS